MTVNTPLFGSLEIRQFRVFDSLKIEQLGHVNLILGKNNIGKSTLLEALYLYANMGSPRIIRKILDARDEPYSSEYTSLAEPDFSNLFYNYPNFDIPQESIHIGRINAPDSALTLSFAWDNSRQNYSTPSLAIKLGAFNLSLPLEKPFDEVNKIWEANRKKKSDSALTTPCVFIPSRGLDKEILHSLWEKISLTDAKQDVIEALRIIEPNIDDFDFISKKNETPSFRISRRGYKGAIPIKAMGDGMNRLVGLSMALSCTKDGILLVDEIENGIHWSVLPDVWKFIVKVAKRLNVQVFATTHSNDCLKVFYMGTKDDDSIDGLAVRIEKRGGAFHAEIFDEQRLAIIVKERIEIR
jgi:hypothetical protein